MMSIIIVHIYKQGSAATNRIFAYAKGYCMLGKTVVLILGSNQDFIAPIIDGVRVVKSIAQNNSLNRKLAKTVKQFYNADSIIQIYGTPALCWHLPKSKYNVFCEYTEVPFYGKRRSFISSIKEHIKLVLTRRTRGLLVISKALFGYYKARGFQNIEIVNMFVDIERFDKALDNPEEKYVAYCGKISLFKDGVDCLIRAFQLFYRQHQDYRLWIIGGFENEETEKRLKQLVQSLQLEGVVKFVGQVSPEQMPSMLKSAQILALARPDNEQAKYGFPTKLGEYLATGKPVVVTKVGEIGDFLTDGVNCRMAEPDNPADFAEKLCWMTDHYADALAVGQKGKQLTDSEFSSLVQCKKALEFINSVVES